MSHEAQGLDLAETLGTQLPYLRRYARALTGSQQAGDDQAAATLEAILADASVFSRLLTSYSELSVASELFVVLSVRLRSISGKSLKFQ